ncbi:MAG TPA: tetratricopeptide repeat protein [Phaeodactylibacter sp.]|nr:tetratricopeptide repeat protein [Phaeodactylibacter sp.]
MRLVCFILISFVAFSTSTLANSADSLLRVLEEQKSLDDLNQLYFTHYQLADFYVKKGEEQYDEAIHHYNLAYQIALGKNNTSKKTDCLYELGNIYEKKNDFPKALEYYFKIIEIEEGKNDFPKKLKTYIQISSIYQSLGDYQKSFENQIQALTLAEKSKDSLSIANSYYNIGGIFFYQNQYKQALGYYQKAKSICDVLGNERPVFSCTSAIGSVYEKLGNNQKSLEYNQRSLALAKKMKYDMGVAYATGNIAINYLYQGDFEKAEEYLKKSIAMKIKLDDKFGAIGGDIDLSKVYVESGKPELAVPVLNRALSLAQKMDSKNRQSDIYKNLATAYDELGKTTKAYSFLEKHIALKDSLINEKTLEEMGQSQQRYELEKKEHEITLLKKENELFGKNEKIQKLQMLIFAIITLGFIVFVWWYKTKLNYQNSVNQLLEEKNELLNGKNEEIRIKNKQLEYSNEDLQQFAYVASHDLKEPLRMINSYTNLLQRRYDDLFDESGKEFMHYVIDAVGRMETLLDDLLDFSRAGSKSAPTDFVSVQDVMVIVKSNLRHKLENLEGTLVVKNKNLPAVKAHRTQLIQLLQNLISNGLKFKGDRNPKVIVDCEKKDKEYVFSVKDNGIGISKENLEKVFEMFRRLHTRDEYEGTGIGLATCKRIVNTWGGDIWVASEEGEGSTFFFSVPCSVAQLEEEEIVEMPALVYNQN